MLRPGPRLVPDGASSGMQPEPPPPKIHAFEHRLGMKKGDDTWKRSTNANGTGATHMRSFHCKLSDDALGFIDQMVNDWLDAHPQYEVKFANTTIGEFQGKLGKEHHLIMQVWV